MDDIIEGEVEESPKALTPEPKVAGKAMTMDFPNAMREIIAGNKVTRLSWENTDYCLLKDGWLEIFTDDFHVWKVNDGDIEGQDWVVVGEKYEQTN